MLGQLEVLWIGGESKERGMFTCNNADDVGIGQEVGTLLGSLGHEIDKRLLVTGDTGGVGNFVLFHCRKVCVLKVYKDVEKKKGGGE
jgi:hypothetical protein